MLKLLVFLDRLSIDVQPPLGGCVLKQKTCLEYPFDYLQPPLGGCVLKLSFSQAVALVVLQPPLGGCVLKQ